MGYGAMIGQHKLLISEWIVNWARTKYTDEDIPCCLSAKRQTQETP